MKFTAYNSVFSKTHLRRSWGAIRHRLGILRRPLDLRWVVFLRIAILSAVRLRYYDRRNSPFDAPLRVGPNESRGVSG